MSSFRADLYLSCLRENLSSGDVLLCTREHKYYIGTVDKKRERAGACVRSNTCSGGCFQKFCLRHKETMSYLRDWQNDLQCSFIQAW
jgi:hypothetical protein